MPLTAKRRALAAAAMVGSLVTGGAMGAVLFGPHLAGAQTTTTTPPAGGNGGSSFKSNEDPAHEAGESAEQEAAEDNGTFRGHRGGSNEDAAHEAKETPEQEAAEDARNAPAPGSSSSVPGPSAQNSSFRRL